MFVCVQVQDKSYFLGLLRTKMNEVVTEIEKLTTEMENMKQEQSTFLTYDKRVKEMAQELTGMYVQYKHHSINCVIVFSFFHILPHQALYTTLLFFHQSYKGHWLTTTYWWTYSTRTQRRGRWMLRQERWLRKTSKLSRS